MTKAAPLLALTSLLLMPRAAAVAQRVDLDGSIGFTGDAWRAAVSSQWRLQAGDRLMLGAGLRLTRYDGRATPYRNQGDVTAGLPATLPVDPSVWALNLMVSGDLRLAGPVAAGANIDLAGVAGGPSRRTGAATLGPARGSLLLYGDNDRGSLNSEFYLSAWLSRRVQVRGGMSHYVVGYTASDASTRTRYLRFDTVPFVAFRWAPSIP